ncbi:hypothetical protein GGI20_000456 [Coemansia sp. BCRC 34301]|nr:hypothetical protein GGI20_000456 [Coemansia sp. BCRC 34301]
MSQGENNSSSPLFTYHRTGGTITPLLSPGTTGEAPAELHVVRRRSRTYAEAGIPARRRSLAYADLMAVFYPPNTMSQPLVTDTPFECREWEGVPDSALSQMPMDAAGVAASWEPTLERAIKSIVSIKAQCVRSFDTETSGTYTATGFVVDATAGLILSNRHVVNPAPVVAVAIFVNYEEVELQPVYRDPVHDFGFFRFDPSKVRFMQLDSIRLAPHKAKVGMEIRVVGNDAGEKLSILAGTLARLDRAAPEYGVGQYNDFNTFYLQAASGTSGGSSGSPVLDIYGDAVALNAGGATKAASSFYLPLSRVVRALDLVRLGSPVPRGTIQAEFEHLAYDELRRLGLDVRIEAKMREAFPASQGMLAVRTAQRGGPAEGSLQSGDIVVALNGSPAIDFVRLEDALDSAIGSGVQFSVWRGCRAFDAHITVQDMADVTPSRFIEVGGGVVNDVSYQVARSYGIHTGGVYVASSGHMLGSANAWRGSVIVSVNNIATPSLDAFADALAQLSEGSRVPIRLFAVDMPHRYKVVIMNVTTHWHALRMATRDERTGSWEYRDLDPPKLRIGAADPQTASLPQLPPALAPADLVWPSLVYLDFHIPYLVDGMKATQFAGPGFIVDRDLGLVACDRDTVPTGVGDVYVTIAGSIVVAGRVEFLHPVYNFAVVRYDPQLIGATPVENTCFHPDYYEGPRRLAQGDGVFLVGVSADQSAVVRRTEVASRGMVSTRECVPPRFRCTNVEGVKLHDQPSCQGGVLCDALGRVMALWVGVSSQDSANKDVSTMAGLDVAVLRPAIDALRRRAEPDTRSLDVILWTMRLASARTLGLGPERIAQIEHANPDNPRLFYVVGLATTESPAARLLATGDVVLECNSRLVQDVSDIGVIYDQKSVDLVVLRDAKEIALTVPTTALAAMETRRVVHWLGALIQQPYRAVHEQIRRLPSDVYVSCTLYGSPANCYGLRPGMWITEVENRPIKSIDDFVSILKEMENESTSYVRITVVNKTEVTRVLSLRVDAHFWPTWQLVRDPTTPTGWNSIHHL